MSTQEEKAKCLRGELYDATDAGLTSERDAAKDLCFGYNALLPSQQAERQEILHKLFGKIGEGCSIEPTFWCDYGYNIRLGKNVYMNHSCVILDDASVEFGDNVFVGPQCGFYCAEHPLDAVTRNTCKEYAKPIKVSDNVWIGGHVTVLGGVTIGEGCVIGAGSVVTRDIPPNTLAVGNPCRHVRTIKQ